MVSLDEYVIMPNHFHGIVVINEFDESRQGDTAGKRVGAMERVGAGDRVGARPTGPYVGNDCWCVQIEVGKGCARSH
ncbi:hypothetical protein CHL67_05105 [Prosthecochloris sp. GSB1]|nr:hypothetical protein CHL67_05105 [Prosthecochloris sp. GSB1]